MIKLIHTISIVKCFSQSKNNEERIRSLIYKREDVGKSKVEQAMKNLEMHNVGGTIVEGYDIDAIRCWNKIVKLAEECTAVFNMIDWGKKKQREYFE